MARLGVHPMPGSGGRGGHLLDASSSTEQRDTSTRALDTLLLGF